MNAEAPAEINDTWAKFAENKDPELRNQLITRYTPLVRFVVSRLGIPPTGLLDAEDLISYGMIGLINAVDRFDPSRGVRFEAFASVRIRGAVIDQLRSLNWLPRSAVSRVRQIEAALAVLEQKLGRPARENEVAAEIGVTTERYRQMLQEMNSTVLSLDAPIGSLSQEDEATSLSELLEDHAAPGPVDLAEQREMLHLLSTAIERLPEREKYLLSLYYQEEFTMKEISKVLGVSESRVCQLHMQAIVRLRAGLSSYQLNEEPDMTDQKEQSGVPERIVYTEQQKSDTKRVKQTTRSDRARKRKDADRQSRQSQQSQKGQATAQKGTVGSSGEPEYASGEEATSDISGVIAANRQRTQRRIS